MKIRDYLKATWGHILLMLAGAAVPALALHFFSGFAEIRYIRPIIIACGIALVLTSAFSVVCIHLDMLHERRKSRELTISISPQQKLLIESLAGGGMTFEKAFEKMMDTMSGEVALQKQRLQDQVGELEEIKGQLEEKVEELLKEGGRKDA